jgi:acetyl-CoA carboxylase biotin carboxylase subunit/acetyl-CoA carboxylase carboxyl transferase beta subunit
MIKKMLVANRGEIAIRILRTCKEMGIETVAVYSQADAKALHVRYADEAVCIGPACAADSYLNMNNILEAALLKGCDSIHPGYGFLSENARFAKLVRECGLIFIGPSPAMLEKLGDKIKAKEIMEQAGIPTVPGSNGAVGNVQDAQNIAREIGYPVLFKAASGGGGRGMRIARSQDEIAYAFHAAKSDVNASFGVDVVYMERLLADTKHIEVQILADQHGHVVHLYERDCSFQRKHQKLIEEAPCENLSDEVRQRIIADAIKAAQYVGYDNVGTIEFLLDRDGKHYFIEMNTRIQVEHTVSEMITGVDIVRHQIQSACGMALTLKQADIHRVGYAIECRINAEDIFHDFAGQPGIIESVHFPSGRPIRVETAICDGMEIVPFYDSLIVKVIARGINRLAAIEAMRTALDETIVKGIPTNLDFQRYILNDLDFVSGTYTTDFAADFIGKFTADPDALIRWIDRRRVAKETSNADQRNNKVIQPEDARLCEQCGEPIALAELASGLFVCTHCGFHFRIGARERIRQLIDESTFEEIDKDAQSFDSDYFPGYGEKLVRAKQSTALNEAVLCGIGKINQLDVCIGVLDANFMMGTMGRVVGDKITRLIERATLLQYPLILVSASGGARMQEGIISLMQMAKTSAALARFDDAGLLYLSVLSDPTTGGVSASFAMLGDIQIAEPQALIGFAGKRVIENTINEILPPHFQTAEFQLENGFIDAIVARKELKRTIADIIALHRVEHRKQDLTVYEPQLINSSLHARSAWERVVLARHAKRPKAGDLLPLLFEHFIPLHGDRHFGDDPALIGGIGTFNGMPVTILAQNKGKDLDENLRYNFGMMQPEGYRKVLRLARQAQKFDRTIITIIDTPGAYPGKGAEERGQAEAIAQCLKLFSTLTVPVIALVLSEGGSGGALALSVADRILMMENAIYSILSPEGFASILWKDETKAAQAADIQKLTSYDLLAEGIVDVIIGEPENGMQADMDAVIRQCKYAIQKELDELSKMDKTRLLSERYAKFRRIGTID